MSDLLPSKVIELTGAGSVSLLFTSELVGRHPATEKVAILQAPTGRSQGIPRMASVTRPDPGHGRLYGRPCQFLSVHEGSRGGVVDSCFVEQREMPI